MTFEGYHVKREDRTKRLGGTDFDGATIGAVRGVRKNGR
jgi:hypothetical protein